MDFGFIDNSVMQDSKNLFMIDAIAYNEFWAAKVEGIRFGSA